ncbi:MAG: cytochrome c-type biogenesis protein CcmH [Gemmatimonadota bacterium]|nr:cytochrome c-type biogenesis protein CcmH [Gemmatimonadota bacterium]
MTMGRREFLASLATLAVTRVARAQGSANTMDGPMSPDAYHSVKLSPKPNAAPQLSDAQRDDLEHRLKCQCGTCVLDVYTCRTTDFTCPVSPSMHVDVMGLVGGGYGAQEILDAFRKVYGERVLMAPAREGLNWLGYLAPFAALGTGAVVVFVLLKRWSRPAREARIATDTVHATPEELARLRDALRNDA